MELIFDRGTLVLSGLSPGADLRQWPGVVWDPRVDAFRAPAWRYPELRDRLRAVSKPWQDRVGDWQSWRVYGWRPVDLRPYQAAALFAWRSAGHQGVVTLPTGAGKTWVALAAMAAQRLPTICVVPTRVLLHQWRRAIAARYDGPVGIWGDGHRQLFPVTVTTYESAVRHMAQWGRRFGLLVVDEAHHFGDSTRDLILEMSAAPARLGLTATPPAVGEAADRLAELVGPTVFQARLAELTGEYLSDFHRLTLMLELTPDERSAYELEYGAFRAFHAPFRQRSPGASWADFLREAGGSDEGRRALAAWRASRRVLAYSRAKADALRWLIREHRQRRTLIFTPDNDTAYRVASEHLVMPITCDIGRAERARALERFREGKLCCLVSSRVLNEGLDVPEAEVGIILGGSGSTREYLQRLGRILRPAPGKRALLCELVTRATSESWRARRRELALPEDLPAQQCQSPSRWAGSGG